MFFLLSANTQHIPRLSILSTRTTTVRPCASRPRCEYGNSKHCRQRPVRGSSRLLWNLRQRRWRLIPLQQQCKCASSTGLCRPRSTEFDLGGQYIQGQHCLPLLDVSSSYPLRLAFLKRKSDNRLQNHCSHICLRLLHRPGHIPRVARGDR